MTKAIETKDLAVGYGQTIVVPDFNLSFESQKITSIIGANGCGKSTILKAIGRIIPSIHGNIIINQQELSTLKNKETAKQLAILPQIPQAPGSLTCGELVAYGRFPYQSGLGRLSQEDREVIHWALKETGMDAFYDCAISDLSGGQRQRVWIAMALAQETDIILLDEPTTYLDLSHQLEVLELLKKLNQEKGTTIVMVLHDVNLASRYSDYLLAMKEGEVLAYGTPEKVLTSQTLAECFQVDAVIQQDERWQKPVCISFDLLRRKSGEN